jgi:hypothetical protein
MERIPDEPRLTLAVEKMEAASWASLASTTRPELRLLVQDIRGATVVLAPNGGPQFQHVFGLGIEQMATRETIQQLIETYRGSGVTSFAVHLCPTARPATLPRWLIDSGLKLAWRSALILRETTNLDFAPPYHRIREASTADAESIQRIMLEAGAGTPEFGETLTNLISEPDWHLLLAFDGNRPISAGGIFMRGEYAWQAPIWTLPQDRNRGAQAEMIGHGLALASRLGARWVTTSWRASPRHRPRTFERLGFQLLYMRSTYRYDPEG